jgi:hypothetical protein
MKDVCLHNNSNHRKFNKIYKENQGKIDFEIKKEDIAIHNDFLFEMKIRFELQP